MRPHPSELPDRLGRGERRRAWVRMSFGEFGVYEMRWRVAGGALASAFEFQRDYPRKLIAELLRFHRDGLRYRVAEETQTTNAPEGT